MSAQESGHFADVLAAAFSNANTNVSLLGESFKYCVPVAGSMGASAEDLAIALGLMANLGLITTETVNIIDNDKIEKAQIACNKALEKYSTDSAQVQTAAANAEKAQIKLNDAIARYGEDSSQAQTATVNLEQAQNKLNLTMSQCGENSPEVQTALINLQKAENNLTAAQDELTAAQKGTIETMQTGQNMSTAI